MVGFVSEPGGVQGPRTQGLGLDLQRLLGQSLGCVSTLFPEMDWSIGPSSPEVQSSSFRQGLVEPRCSVAWQSRIAPETDHEVNHSLRLPQCPEPGARRAGSAPGSRSGTQEIRAGLFASSDDCMHSLTTRLSSCRCLLQFRLLGFLRNATCRLESAMSRAWQCHTFPC